MSTARKVLGNTLVQFGGKLVTAVLSIVVLRIITNYLGVAGYGDYSTIYELLALFGIAADFGIFTITVKEMSKDEQKIPYILGNVMGLRTALTLLIMLIAAVSIFLVPAYAGTVIPIGVLIATLSTFLTLLNGTVSTVLQVHLKMQYATLSLVIGKLVSVGYIAIVALWLFSDDKVTGFQHLIWAGVWGNLIMLIITSYFVSKLAPIRYRFDLEFWKKIFITSLPYGVALTLNQLYFRLDTVLLTTILPRTVELSDGSSVCEAEMCGNVEAGFYGVGMKFLEMLILVPVYYMNSVLPTMTRFLEEGKEKVRKVVQYSFEFLLAAAAPIVVGGFILAKPIVDLIANEAFASGGEHAFGSDVAIRLLIFAMLFSFINSLFSFTLVVMNRQKKLMIINAICVVVNIVGNLIVIPYFGFRGAAATSILCEIFILIFTGIAVKKALGFNLSYKTALKIIVSAGMMGAVVGGGYFLLKNSWFVWQLAILVPVGAAVYGGMLLQTKAITPEMWGMLRKR